MFNKHIKTTLEKAKKQITALIKIMPNIGGPGTRKRLLLNDMIISTQRKMLLRVASAYLTASADSLQVITSCNSLDLLGDERFRLHQKRRKYSSGGKE